MKKFKNLNLIISIAAPVLLAIVLVIIVSYGWYIKRQQVATIDATAKNVSVEYSFDEDTHTNVYNYNVEHLVFFDSDSEFEFTYLDEMAVKLEVYLKNKGTTPVNYSIQFKSKKISTKDSSNNIISTAYIDCLYGMDFDSTVKTINGAKAVSLPYVTYETITEGDDTYVVATFDSSKSVTYYTRSGTVGNYVYTPATGSFDGTATYYKLVYSYDVATTYNAGTTYYQKWYYVEVEVDEDTENINDYYIINSNDEYENATEYVEGETYYQKTTTESADSSFVYEVATGVTSSNVTGYFVRVENYVEVEDLTENDFRLSLTEHSLAPSEDKTLVLTMYLFGIQEIDTAKNEVFLYENYETKTLKDIYKFDITVESIPIKDVEATENETNTNTSTNTGDSTSTGDSGSGDTSGSGDSTDTGGTSNSDSEPQQP